MMVKEIMNCTIVKGMIRGSILTTDIHCMCILYYYTYRRAVVHLHCDETDNQPRIITNGDKDETLVYVFHLYTNQTCFASSSGTSSSSSSSIVGYIGLGIIFV